MSANLYKPWNVLCWNVRGLNATRKWDSVRNKVVEASCEVVCFQETKKDYFDSDFIRKILPVSFDSFLFVPSEGASGGLLVAWKSSLFEGTLKFSNTFAMAVQFISKHDDSTWNLMNVYGPCTTEGKRELTDWLKFLDLIQEEDWMLLEDFNLYRVPENRNRPGADITDMFLFNSTISLLGLIKVPHQGKKFTWSNMQSPPLLEKLDWVFTNTSWTLSFPNTTCKTLVMEISDHNPMVITISIAIPKVHIFRFENYWLQRQCFNKILLKS